MVEWESTEHYDLLMFTTPPSLLERLRTPCDNHAWALFVSLYTPYIFSLARKSGLNREQAADIVQDVLLLLTKKMPDFRYNPSLSFRAWLRTVVHNRIHEIARRRSLPILQGAIDCELAESSGSATLEDIEYRRHLMARALEIMQRDFAATTWKACWEHVVSGKTAAEVGKELGISEGAVYVAKCRVLQRLREELKGLL